MRHGRIGERIDDERRPAHDARCHNGWLGEDLDGRMVPCPLCKPHLARPGGYSMTTAETVNSARPPSGHVGARNRSGRHPGTPETATADVGVDSEPTPAPSWVDEIVVDLDRLGLPSTTGFGTAQDALRAAGRGVGTDRLRVALKARKQRDGIPAAVRRKPAPSRPTGPHRVSLPPLLAAIVNEEFVGAACVGHHDLFDDELDNIREAVSERDTRHVAAVAICRTCPVLETCRTVADETGRHARGVWATTVRNPTRPIGRPRKDKTA